MHTTMQTHERRIARLAKFKSLLDDDDDDDEQVIEPPERRMHPFKWIQDRALVGRVLLALRQRYYVCTGGENQPT